MDAKILSFYFITACLISGALSNLFSPCKVNDVACIENSVNNALPVIFDGIPELGVGSSDPLFHDFINGSYATTEVYFLNTTITGYKQCTVKNLKLNDDTTTAQCELHCKSFKLVGQYRIKGDFLSIPVDQNGDYVILTDEYFVILDMKLGKVKRDDGNTYAVVKDFKLTPEPLAAIKVDFKDLFKNKEHLVSSPSEFFKKHWVEICDLLQLPLWYTLLARVMGNVNVYLEHVALEDITLH